MAVEPTNNKGLSFASTESFRKALMGKNLTAYKVEGVYSPPIQQLNYETILTDSAVKDSPNEYISENLFGEKLYPLNKYGPEGGYNLDVTYNRPPLAVNPNQGEYNPKDTKMDLLNEFFIDLSFIENKYGPQGGFQNMITITDIQNNNKIYTNYWGPPSFLPSSYQPLQILQNSDPTGSDGNLSADSYIAKLGATSLKQLFQERIDVQRKNDNPSQNQLQSLKDPYTASLITTGKQPLITRNYTITIPENPQGITSSFYDRLGDTYYPVSPIPGSYWEENTLFAGATQQISTGLNALNRLTGGIIGGALNTIRNPSQVFIANTGDGQKSVLFANLDFNRYKPSYDRTVGGIVGVAQNLIRTALTTLGDPTGGYYVGSPTKEPGQIVSPGNQIPTNVFGQQVFTPVYGPDELSKLYEGNDTTINFGLQAKSFDDGGGLDGSLVWVSPKYKSNAGFKAGTGGKLQALDKEFNSISNSYLKSESTNITFKGNSILDNTQRLINSADNLQGERRLKHVGNAINQVSKVFNDGYKEITKGSKVLSYKNNTTGYEVGIEYCRVFAKDTPYFTYNDLQKVEGITTTNRKFTNSVLDNTFNLNIAPTPYDKGSTNIVLKDGKKSVKKYMFSIENLAWRTSSRDGFTYDDLPDSERGPNGGRIMWFPPYNIKFSETISPTFNPTTFLGRPEPVYTYSQTSRTGQLSWTIIVDHPSILNLIVKKQLNGVNNERVQSIVDSFFAGCTKYDLIELAKKFNTIPSSDLIVYQDILSKPTLKTEDAQEIKEELGTVIPESQDETDTDKAELETNFKGLGFYFDNKLPLVDTEDVPYDTFYNEYIKLKSKYENNSKTLKDFQKNTTLFFDTVVIDNFKKFTSGEENKGLLTKLFNYLENKKGTVKIILIASASALGAKEYNNSLSQRRKKSIENFFREYKIGNKNLSQFVDEKSLIIEIKAVGSETIFEKDVTPVTESGSQVPIDCKKLQLLEAQIYSVSAMACRRVAISEIVVTPNPPVIKTVKRKSTTIIPSKKIGIKEKIKSNITQKILRSLLTEDSYFELLKEDAPMIYQNIVNKIKYFNPAFHSTTPEGLNSRLTFLQQCTRPGDTIPVIGPDGKPRFNDALNTSFGTPPILVLRIGDFYNTKIIPSNLSITYETLTLDTNPEGIGVQPMMANISLSFNFIGGSGLAKPIEQLQNAISFNYYANTEIYDDRAVPTEDTTTIDREVLQSILDKEPTNFVENLKTQQQNNGGSTIGQILSSNSNQDGTTGDISYDIIMNKLSDENKNYFTTLLNQTTKIFQSYNKGILQLIDGVGPDTDRYYTKGKLNSQDINIFGKPNLTSQGETKDRFQFLFDEVIDRIKDGTNPLIYNTNQKNEMTEKELKLIGTYLTDYIKNLSTTFSNSANQILQELTIQQQNFVQVIRKINLILNKTDGNILAGGEVKVYNLTPNDALVEIDTDTNKLVETINNFNYDTISQNIVFDGYFSYQDFKPVNNNFETLNYAFYMVIVRTFQKNKNELRNAVLKGELLKNKKLVKTFDDVYNDLVKLYLKELKDEEAQLNKGKKILENKYVVGFENLTFPKGKKRKTSYTTIPSQTEEDQKNEISNLYKTVNVNTDNLTFDGKVTFN